MKKIYLILPILAGLMFGSSGIFVRTLTQNGIDSTTLLFLRFSIAIIPLLIAIFLTDAKLLKIDPISANLVQETSAALGLFTNIFTISILYLLYIHLHPRQLANIHNRSLLRAIITLNRFRQRPRGIQTCQTRDTQLDALASNLHASAKRRAALR